MPAHKRSLPEDLREEENYAKHSRVEREAAAEEEERGVRPHDEDLKETGEEEEEEAKDSGVNPSASGSEEKTEYIFVELSEVRRDVQCPICLGIIKKTRTVMECLHRFCRECIDKSMRTGNNECPACRTHCASRRSLRDDPRFDALIAALFPDIDEYEEEDLAIHEEEKNRNRQIQASIAQIFQRQSEALVRRRTLGKDSSTGFMARSQQNLRSVPSRRRRGSRVTETHTSEYNVDENNGGKDSSSNDERGTEIRHRKCKRRTGPRLSLPSSSAATLESGYTGNDSEGNKESRGISPGIVWSPEIPAWVGGSARSHTRHGSNSGGNSRSSHSSRISRLVDYYKNYNENYKEQVDVFFVLISLDEQSAPPIAEPFHSCRADLSVKCLREYVAHRASLQPEEVEIVVDENSSLYSTFEGGIKPLSAVDSCSSFPSLGEETLAEVQARCPVNCRYPMVLAYRRKATTT